MQLYVNFKCSQKPEAPTHQACNVSAVKDYGGGRQGSGGYDGGRRGGPNARTLGLVLQEEVNNVTTVKNKYYPALTYNKFTPAKKVMYFQLRNPGKTPGT
jgi:hypothetical protein